MKLVAMISGAVVLALSATVQAGTPPAKYTYCMACHASGLVGAPKTGDVEAWKARIAAVGSIDALVATSKAGKNAMPPKGTCADCTDAELKELIQFMAAPQ